MEGVGDGLFHGRSDMAVDAPHSGQAVAEAAGLGDFGDGVFETGRERSSAPAECSWGLLGPDVYSSWLGIVVLAQFGGVAGPVGAGLVHPADGGGRGEVEQVGQYGGGQVRGEVDHGGSSAGLGGDTEPA